MTASPRVQTPADGIAWVTGASTGIGRATALELVRRGWTVAATARTPETLEALAAEAGGRIIAAPCDVTDTAAVYALVERLEAAHGPIALAFLNAGMSIHAVAPKIDPDVVRRIYDLNVHGVFNGIGALLPRMAGRRSGQIAICASVAGFGGLPRSTAYSSSKAAMISTAVGLAIECAPLGVLVQCVNPGYVDTPLTKKNRFPMPFIVTAEEAGRRCAAGFARGRFEITFPRRFSYLIKAINLLPYGLYIRLVRWGTARGLSREPPV